MSVGKKVLVNDMVKTFLRAAGTELGKRVGKVGAVDKKENGVSMGAVKSGVDLMSREYDWKEIDRNMHNLAGYMGAIIPDATLIFVTYIMLPPLLGAGSYALAGVELSQNIYMMSNGCVLLGGLGKVMADVEKVKSDSNYAQYEIKNSAEL